MMRMWYLSVFKAAPEEDLVVQVPLTAADVGALLRILGGSSEGDLRYMTPVTSRAQLEQLRAFADFPLDTAKYKYYVEELQD